MAFGPAGFFSLKLTCCKDTGIYKYFENSDVSDTCRLTTGFAGDKGCNKQGGSIVSRVKPRGRAPLQTSDSVFAAVLVDDLFKQQIEQKDVE